MAYEMDGYKLFKRAVTLKGGRVQTIYFFSKRVPKSGDPTDMPQGYTVGINSRTGLPFLRKG